MEGVLSIRRVAPFPEYQITYVPRTSVAQPFVITEGVTCNGPDEVVEFLMQTGMAAEQAQEIVDRPRAIGYRLIAFEDAPVSAEVALQMGLIRT